MKKILFALSFILMSSCIKEDLPKDYTEENEQEIITYLEKHNLTATKDAYGVYYIIEEEGTGLQPVYDGTNSIYDVVTVNYTGYYTNGEIFEERDNGEAIFSLYGVISGWKIGIPYFKEGGKGKIIIPSRWGYGSNDYSNGNTKIPGGSVLVFDIELLSVNYNKENDKEITDYLAENNLTDTAIKTESGLYYIIEEEGTGENPTKSSTVTVDYKGYLTDESEFDSNTNYSNNLSKLIQGWQEGIPYFKEGGSGKLLIPSRLGYSDGYVRIFDIKLISIDD